MIDGFFYGINNTNIHNIVIIFCCITVICDMFTVNNLTCCIITFDFYFFKSFFKFWKELVGHILMYKYCFYRITYRRSLNLCIDCNSKSLIKISIFIHIEMTDTSPCFNNRYCRILNNKLNESCTTSRDDDIHIFIGMDEFSNDSMI